MMSQTTAVSDAVLTRTPSRGVIRVEGPDTAAFLHAQLTQRITGLAGDSGTFAAWLDPRGRVLACFDVVPGPTDGVDLLAPADLVETLAQRLRMFVLRRAVTITVPADLRCYAVTGAADDWLKQRGFDTDERWFGVARGQQAVWLRIAPALAYGYGSAGADVFASAVDGGDDVEAAEIALGRPQIGTATSGSFTAHMLNLDRLGAIAFDKGCYPGQEVVARTHNLGTPKRRMFGFAAATDSTPAAGGVVADANGEPAGTVVRAARSHRGVVLLAVVRVEAADRALALAACGSSLVRMPVPGEPDA